jgi:hypothetical protein
MHVHVHGGSVGVQLGTPVPSAAAGPLDVEVFKQALDVVVARHHSLRAHLVEIGGKVHQVRGEGLVTHFTA